MIRSLRAGRALEGSHPDARFVEPRSTSKVMDWGKTE